VPHLDFPTEPFNSSLRASRKGKALGRELILAEPVEARYVCMLTCVNLEAGVAELADAPDSKSGGRKAVWVRFPPPAPTLNTTRFSTLVHQGRSSIHFASAFGSLIMAETMAEILF
jgi:hypothetical protein